MDKCGRFEGANLFIQFIISLILKKMKIYVICCVKKHSIVNKKWNCTNFKVDSVSTCSECKHNTDYQRKNITPYLKMLCNYLHGVTQDRV